MNSARKKKPGDSWRAKRKRPMSHNRRGINITNGRRYMIRKLASVICAIIVFASLLQAHGNATHLMGTVTAVDAQSVTIKDQAGKSIVVTLDKTTKYIRDKKPASTGDLKIGTRVVIDAKMDAKTKAYTAEQIQLGTEAATKKK